MIKIKENTNISLKPASIISSHSEMSFLDYDQSCFVGAKSSANGKSLKEIYRFKSFKSEEKAIGYYKLRFIISGGDSGSGIFCNVGSSVEPSIKLIGIVSHRIKGSQKYSAFAQSLLFHQKWLATSLNQK